MYEFYFDKVLLPVTPDKLTLEIDGADKTYTLMNEGEISVLKSPKLTGISFDFLLPNTEYPFAVYGSKFVPAVYYLDMLKKYKEEKKPFQFKVIRNFPNGKMIFETDMKVSIVSYTPKESADNGFDVVVSIKLKQYRDYGTKTCKIETKSTKGNTKENVKPTVKVQATRAVSDNAPTQKGETKVITVKKGDTLWGICKTYLGDGSLYPTVAKENGISNPNKIQIGQKITLSTNVTSGNVTKQTTVKTSGGSKNKAPFTVLTSAYGVVKANVKTWNEAIGYYQANGGNGKGWQIVDSDKDVISV
jgi:LysM repeat protein